MFFLSEKHVLLRDQRLLFFQALKQNWKWVRAGMLLDWERQFKNNTRVFSDKRLKFSYGICFFQGWDNPCQEIQSFHQIPSLWFATGYVLLGLIYIDNAWYMALEVEEQPLFSSSSVWRHAKARQEKPSPGRSRQGCSQHRDGHPDQLSSLKPWMQSRLHLWLRVLWATV